MFPDKNKIYYLTILIYLSYVRASKFNIRV